MKAFFMLVSGLAAFGGALLFSASGMACVNKDDQSMHLLEAGGGIALFGALLLAWIGGGRP